MELLDYNKASRRSRHQRAPRRGIRTRACVGRNAALLQRLAACATFSAPLYSRVASSCAGSHTNLVTKNQRSLVVARHDTRSHRRHRFCASLLKVPYDDEEARRP